MPPAQWKAIRRNVLAGVIKLAVQDFIATAVMDALLLAGGCSVSAKQARSLQCRRDCFA